MLLLLLPHIDGATPFSADPIREEKGHSTVVTLKVLPGITDVVF
ncbi:MAG TPA: hypothetical protein VFJ51_07680 [Nitrososphaeraceae archaeon]|nr:hypothetical protein [Nitrososphaeraceae archaeon]